MNFKVCSIIQNLFWPLQILQSVPQSFFSLTGTFDNVVCMLCGPSWPGITTRLFFLLLHFLSSRHLLSRSQEGKASSHAQGWSPPPQPTSFILPPQAHPALVFLSNFIHQHSAFGGLFPVPDHFWLELCHWISFSTSIIVTYKMWLPLWSHVLKPCIICSLTFLRFFVKGHCFGEAFPWSP